MYARYFEKQYRCAESIGTSGKINGRYIKNVQKENRAAISFGKIEGLYNKTYMIVAFSVSNNICIVIIM